MNTFTERKENLVYLNENNEVVGEFPVFEIGVFETNETPPEFLNINVSGNDFFTQVVTYDETDEKYYMQVGINSSVYSVIEYTGIDKVCHMHVYDEGSNRILPIKDDPTYIIDLSAPANELKWTPDPALQYDLHGDGKLYTYDVENDCWWPVA